MTTASMPPWSLTHAFWLLGTISGSNVKVCSSESPGISVPWNMSVTCSPAGLTRSVRTTLSTKLALSPVTLTSCTPTSSIVTVNSTLATSPFPTSRMAWLVSSTLNHEVGARRTSTAVGSP